jgi:hypothetical protein
MMRSWSSSFPSYWTKSLLPHNRGIEESAIVPDTRNFARSLWRAFHPALPTAKAEAKGHSRSEERDSQRYREHVVVNVGTDASRALNASFKNRTLSLQPANSSRSDPTYRFLKDELQHKTEESPDYHMFTLCWKVT